MRGELPGMNHAFPEYVRIHSVFFGRIGAANKRL